MAHKLASPVSKVVRQLFLAVQISLRIDLSDGDIQRSLFCKLLVINKLNFTKRTPLVGA